MCPTRYVEIAAQAVLPLHTLASNTSERKAWILRVESQTQLAGPLVAPGTEGAPFRLPAKKVFSRQTVTMRSQKNRRMPPFRKSTIIVVPHHV